jgi:hypothetical protein
VASRLGLEQPLALQFYVPVRGCATAAAALGSGASVRCSREQDGEVVRLQEMLRLHHSTTNSLLYTHGRFSVETLTADSSAGLATLALFSAHTGRALASDTRLQLTVAVGETVGGLMRRLLQSGVVPAGFLHRGGGDRAARLRLLSTQVRTPLPARDVP